MFDNKTKPLKVTEVSLRELSHFKVEISVEINPLGKKWILIFGGLPFHFDVSNVYRHRSAINSFSGSRFSYDPVYLSRNLLRLGIFPLPLH